MQGLGFPIPHMPKMPPISDLALDLGTDMNMLKTSVVGDLVKRDRNKINKKYRYPASKKLAGLHTQSIKYGYNSNRTQSGQKPKVCLCCNQPCNTQNIPICYPTTQIKQNPFRLRSGVAMFFTFIKMNIIYLILRFFICDIFNILSSFINGQFCKNQETKSKCTQTFFSSVSAYNKFTQNGQNFIFIQDALHLAVILLSIIFFFFYRRLQYNIYANIDATAQTQDDYTLLVENIPILDFQFGQQINGQLQFDYQHHLKIIFEDKIRQWLNRRDIWNAEPGTIEQDFNRCLQGKQLNPHIVTTVTLCFDLTEMQKVRQVREQVMDNHIQYENSQGPQFQAEEEQINIGGEEDLSKQQNKIKVINEAELNLSKLFAVDNSVRFNLTHFVGRAFISFQYQHYRQYIMRQCENDSTFLLYNMQSLSVKRASNPEDIYWQNMKIQPNQRFKSILISYLILFMVLCFAFGSLVGNDVIKGTSLKEGENLNIQSKIQNYMLTIFATVFTLIINTGLSFIVIELTKFQRHQTRSQYLFSVIVKSVITQFFNTALIYYIISLILHKPYLSSAGLVIQVTSLIVVSGFIQITTNAMNFGALMRRALLWWNYRSTSETEPIKTYQIRLNSQFEYVEFDMASRYAYYLLQIFTVSFYSYITPIGVPALIFIFFLQYWVDKANLFYRSSLAYDLNFTLSRNILKVFQCSIFIFAVGNFLFSLVLHRNFANATNIVAMVISFLYVIFLLFVPTSIEKKIFARYESLETPSYQDCQKEDKFLNTYWTSNPATMYVREKDINTNQDIMFQVGRQFAEEKDLLTGALGKDISLLLGGK